MIDYRRARTAMVDSQVRPSDVTRYAVIEAMMEVPRELFVPRAHRAVAYAEMAVPLAPGRLMLEPRILAKMLDALELRAGELALDVGAGYGYGAAVMARMGATVVALEDGELATHLAEAVASYGADGVLVERGPLAGGAPASGPYDVIVVEGGVETLPAALLDQLAEGGRLAAVEMQGVFGRCRIWRRDGTAISSLAIFDAAAPVLPGFDAARSFTF
jgi:protein-L-isoaspartate(D-aspartate) O-methyltransferase